jgi:hypothetical protein
MPQDSVYGAWPRSGEIDLMEARGNDPANYLLGSDTIYSTIHWGLDYFTDQSEKTASWYTRQRGSYASGFHTYVFRKALLCESMLTPRSSGMGWNGLQNIFTSISTISYYKVFQ